MIQIGLTGVYFDGAKKALMENVPEGYEITFVNGPEEYDKLAHVSYIINRLAVDSQIFYAAKELKLLQKWGAGFDDCDIRLAGRLGIPVANCPGVNSRPVAELALLHMLSVYRNLIAINRNLKEGKWPKSEFFGRSYMIYGKTVGIVGLGNIGKKVAQMVAALGAHVQYYDIVRQWEQEAQFGYDFVPFEQLIQTSDIISIHCPQKEDTIDMFSDAEFAQMKKTAVLINTARGPIVNQDALLKALTRGQILGAGMDNFNEEPLPANHPLLLLPNVSATAHAGGNTADNDINMVQYCYSNIVNFENGRPFNSERDLLNAQYLVKK